MVDYKGFDRRLAAEWVLGTTGDIYPISKNLPIGAYGVQAIHLAG
jgi:hypothetical protein